MSVNRLIRAVEIDIQDLVGLTGIHQLSPEIIDALVKTKRENFCPQEVREFAYDNRALPIGHGQTISQPLIVALMTQLLMPQKNHHVLEVGTGSGYQSAVLSHLVKSIVSVEKIPVLAERAKMALGREHISNVSVVEGNGCFGNSSNAPYDSIIVTAAADEVPRRLVEQLKEGGRIVIPLSKGFGQSLYLGVKKRDQLELKEIISVIFVPLKC